MFGIQVSRWAKLHFEVQSWKVNSIHLKPMFSILEYHNLVTFNWHFHSACMILRNQYSMFSWLESPDLQSTHCHTYWFNCLDSTSQRSLACCLHPSPSCWTSAHHSRLHDSASHRGHWAVAASKNWVHCQLEVNTKAFLQSAQGSFFLQFPIVNCGTVQNMNIEC